MKLTTEKAKELGKKSSRKGIPNKSTAEIRDAFQMLVTDELPNLKKWLNQVAEENPEKALDIIVKFSDFVIPKLNRTEIQTEINVHTLLQLTPQERQRRIIELQKEEK